MIDDQALVSTITDSPLSPEDKVHWKELLPRLSPDQRERLHHSLTAKTEISRAIKLIEKALRIIAEAEAEAEAEVKDEEIKKTERKELLKELKDIKQKEEEILLDEETLKKKQDETKAQIASIREELRKLSVEVHGKPPPSYAQPQGSSPTG